VESQEVLNMVGENQGFGLFEGREKPPEGRIILRVNKT
jgi:hypothetical protein